MTQQSTLSRSKTLFPPTEVLGDAEVSGGIYFRHLKWVEEKYGPDAVIRVRALLPEALRDRLVMPSSRVKFADVITLDRAIHSLYGAAHPDLFAELGRHSAEMLRRSPSERLNGMGIHEFLAHSAKNFRGKPSGRAEYIELGPTAGRMQYFDLAIYSRISCATMRGYYAGHIVVHGGEYPDVKESSCVCEGALTCTFELRWRNV